MQRCGTFGQGLVSRSSAKRQNRAEVANLHRCVDRGVEASLLRAFEWSNFGAETASSEKLRRGRNVPLQPSSAMGHQLTDLRAVAVTAALKQAGVSSSGRSRHRTHRPPMRSFLSAQPTHLDLSVQESNANWGRADTQSTQLASDFRRFMTQWPSIKRFQSTNLIPPGTGSPFQVTE